jgi:xanthine dehydrogenase YagS FAD-binding subunit
VSIAAVALEISGGACRNARVYLGAVAPVPWRAEGAEAALSGKKISPEVAEAAGAAAVAGAKPLAQNAYKIQATRAAVKRAILIAATGKWS